MSDDDKAARIVRGIESAEVIAFPKNAEHPARASEGDDGGSASASTDDSSSSSSAGAEGPEVRDDDADNGDNIRQVIDGMNREWSLVVMGGRAVIMREQPKASPEEQVVCFSTDAFKTYFLNATVRKVTWITNKDGDREKAIKYVNRAAFWLRHADRRTYDGVEFVPLTISETRSQRPAPCETPGYYNFWRGFSVSPSDAPATERVRRYGVFRDHLMTNICSGDEALFNWLWAWCAHMVQRPRERIGTAVVLRGKMGVGKTVLGDVIGSLFASHYFLVDNHRYLTGQFNGHMATCLLLQIDEGFWAGDKAAEGQLKGLITSAKMMVEFKGVDPLRRPNYVRLLFTSNEGWVVPAGMEERRFAVLDVAKNVIQNHDYFAEMFRELDDGGREALLADLLAYDLDAEGAANVRVIPKTEALLEQKIRSLDPVPTWWLTRLQHGTPTQRTQKWVTKMPITTLFNDYLRASEKIGVRRRSAETEFGFAMKRLMPGLQRKKSRVWVEITNPDGRTEEVERNVWCYVLPELAEARALFEEAVGQTIDWGPESEGDSAPDMADAPAPDW